VKRLLVPPVILTGIAFGALFVWAWSVIARFLDAVKVQSSQALDLEPGFWKNFVDWMIGLEAIVWLAKAGGFVLFIVLSSFLALWTFSIAYEAIAGPFLDVVQARIETRWFGRDPRAALEKKIEYPLLRAVWKSALCLALTVGFLWGFFSWKSAWSWWLLIASPLPFAIATRLDRDYAAWLGWAVGNEVRMLYVSIKASLLAGVILVAFFWIKFIPFIGFILFAGLAGFCTALTLLDIPFSRRRYELGTRLKFLLANFGPIVALGIVTSLIFVVPFFGPLIGVPSASIGGQWLLCRLDKNMLRPRDARIARRPPSRDGGV
jgi:uncharacterized protein involved in cysteine biosynthesis